MPDEVSPSKRGRKAAATAEKAEKPEPKKRGKDSKADAEDGASPVKRGRGRPKGTTKKKAAPKATGKRNYYFLLIIY